MEGIFDCNGRPAMKTGERPMKGKHGPYTMVLLRFIDGQQPQAGKMTRGQFDKLKPIRGHQALVWARVDHLTRVDRMEPRRAQVQAMAELNKGILTC